MSTRKSSRTYDVVGIILSGTCMVHCLLLPFAVLAFPLLQFDILREETFHLLMLTVILPSSLAAFILGAQRHRDTKTITLGLFALTLLVVTALVGHNWIGYVGERIVTTLAGGLLAAAHVLNYRRARGMHHQAHAPEAQ